MLDYFALLGHKSLHWLMWRNTAEGILCPAQCFHESEETRHMSSVKFPLDKGHLGTECSH